MPQGLFLSFPRAKDHGYHWSCDAGGLVFSPRAESFMVFVTALASELMTITMPLVHTSYSHGRCVIQRDRHVNAAGQSSY